MSQTIRITASPMHDAVADATCTDSEVMPSRIATEYAHRGWHVEQLSVNGQVRRHPYGLRDVLIENGMPVMDDDETADAPPSRLWYLLGIPACIVSIVAGVGLLAREADRRLEARHSPRVIIIAPHHAQEAAK